MTTTRDTLVQLLALGLQDGLDRVQLHRCAALAVGVVDATRCLLEAEYCAGLRDDPPTVRELGLLDHCL